ncbi:MAG: dynamin family protein [Vicinamibacterales bacterium]
MRQSILSRSDRQLLDAERSLLEELQAALERLEASAENRDALARSIRQLDELFLLVVVGEFNAGKSAFINALLGRHVLKEGVTPTTTRVNVVQFGDEVAFTEGSPDILIVTAPVEFLREIHIVDTPGTNAVIREHERITAEFVPRSDLVLFLTSADRPFTESERAFLELVRDWGKKVVVVLNKIDLLGSEEDLKEVLAFVEGNARRLLGIAPDTFAVSSRLAMQGRDGDPAARVASRFDALEDYIHRRLDERERLRLKLMNPVGVGIHLAERYLSVVNERLALISEDLRLLEDVDTQLAAYRSDLRSQFELRLAGIEKVLLEMEQRGHSYFDEMLRIGRLFDLLNKAKVQEGFEREVVADAPAQVEQRVSDLIDALVEADLRSWRGVTDHLAERRRQYRERIVADPELAGFQLERRRLVDSVGQQAQRVVESYDRRAEAEELAEGARNAVATAAAVGAGALGLGAIVAAAATTAAADVTGLVMAGVMATIGFFVIPAKRRRVKTEMRDKVTWMREKLARALREQFERELERSASRLDESVGPYRRFVRGEHNRLGGLRALLQDLHSRLVSLKSRVAALGEPVSR